jgi:hypothetical protein
MHLCFRSRLLEGYCLLHMPGHVIRDAAPAQLQRAVQVRQKLGGDTTINYTTINGL